MFFVPFKLKKITQSERKRNETETKRKKKHKRKTKRWAWWFLLSLCFVHILKITVPFIARWFGRDSAPPRPSLPIMPALRMKTHVDWLPYHEYSSTRPISCRTTQVEYVLYFFHSRPARGYKREKKQRRKRNTPPRENIYCVFVLYSHINWSAIYDSGGHGEEKKNPGRE